MIKVTGQKEYISNKRKQVLEEFVHYSRTRLKMKRVNICISVQKKVFQDNNQWDPENCGGVWGYAWRDKGINKICLNPLIMDDYLLVLETLGHELCHIDQFRTKRLKSLQLGWNFEGDYWKQSEISEMTEDEYVNLPWEVEAEQIGARLSAEFVCKYYNTNEDPLVSYWGIN